MLKLRDILTRATAVGASDIHLKADRVPIFRVESDLREDAAEIVAADDLRAMVAAIMPPSVADVFRADREVDFAHTEPGVGRFRVSAVVAQGVPTLALRHVKTEIPTLEALRLPELLKDLVFLQRGIVLLCGTTGSGKSTTLAALVGEINRTQCRRIVTVEDPVEFLFADDRSVITQREVGIDTPSYEHALAHLLRQDPDVVLIGEMRDASSIRVALLAAQTGHLVLSTLHAGTSAMAIPRILDMFPADEQDTLRMTLADTQHAIVCQRLIRDVQGNVAPAVEILRNTPLVRKLIERNRLEVLNAAIETGQDDGMQTFNQAIYSLIREGVISEEQGMRYATSPESLKMNLRGIFLDEGHRILSDLTV